MQVSLKGFLGSCSFICVSCVSVCCVCETYDAILLIICFVHAYFIVCVSIMQCILITVILCMPCIPVLDVMMLAVVHGSVCMYALFLFAISSASLFVMYTLITLQVLFVPAVSSSLELFLGTLCMLFGSR